MYSNSGRASIKLGSISVVSQVGYLILPSFQRMIMSAASFSWTMAGNRAYNRTHPQSPYVQIPLAPSPHMQEFARRLPLCLLAGGCSLWLQVPICGSKSTTTRQGWQSKLLVPTLRLMIKSGVRGRFFTRSSWSAIDSQSSHKEGNPSSTYPRITLYIYHMQSIDS